MNSEFVVDGDGHESLEISAAIQHLEIVNADLEPLVVGGGCVMMI